MSIKDSVDNMRIQISKDVKLTALSKSRGTL